MEEPTRILFLAAEADPLVKVAMGVIADRSPARWPACRFARTDGPGIEIRLVLPYHHSVCRLAIRSSGRKFVIPTPEISLWKCMPAE